ncbi:MAG TPA: alpha/beta hydrolase [Humisphaera sp.]|nr:alpha/beta hydrolase [Humisphaera sp.]
MGNQLLPPLRFRWNLIPAIILLSLSFHAVADEPTVPPAPQKIMLWPDKAPIGEGNFEPSSTAAITVHRPAVDKSNGAAVVICPGGGYGGLVTGAEGHGIAKWLVSHGVTGVVLEYRLPKGRAFVPLLDAQRAIRIVRANAKDWKLNPDRIGIAGFSAGGHLASTAGTHFDAGDPKAADAVDRTSSRPDFMILVYPVIVTGEGAHRGSVTNLLGKNPTPEMLKLFSNEQQVTDQTPPTFIASALDDSAVPSASNSGAFYAALQKHKIPSRYLELPHGGHGLNGYKGPMWDAWQTQSLEFLAAQGFIPKKDAAATAP